MAIQGAGGRRIVVLILLCPLGGAANVALSVLAHEGLHLPLFLDTLFTTALTFSAGLLSGVSTALLTILTAVATGINVETPEAHLFVLCSIAEVVLVWIFRHRFEKLWPQAAGQVSYPFIAAASWLLLLALISCTVISVLGGLIDTALFAAFSQTRTAFSPEGVFRMGLLRNGVSLLWANILARFPINLVDRFIVIFGGYGVSRLIGKICPPPLSAN